MDDNTQDFVKAFIGLGYMQGANDQRKIDIEIFLEVLERCKDICSERGINLSSLLIMSELAKLTKEE